MPILNCEGVLFVILVLKARGWKSSWRNCYHAKAVSLCMAFRISWRSVHQINSECFVCVADTAQVRKSPSFPWLLRCAWLSSPQPLPSCPSRGRTSSPWGPCGSCSPVGGKVLGVLCGAALWLTFRKWSLLSTVRNHSSKYLLEVQLAVTLS